VAGRTKVRFQLGSAQGNIAIDLDRLGRVTSNQRIGAVFMRVRRLIVACLLLVAPVATTPAYGQQTASRTLSARDSFFTPRAHQFDLELADNSLFDDGSSLVRRRQDSVRGSALHLRDDLGVDTLQMPTLHLDYWFNELNAVEFQFRYLALYGSEPLRAPPVTFNGDLILPGQKINTNGTTWFTAGLFYERRISFWLYGRATLPEFLRGWDLRPKIGLEFVYLDFQINNGHPHAVSAHAPASGGGVLDVRGRWHDQELPVPTIGIEARRELAEHFDLEITAQGAWINKWNSLRSEGGTVYLSQSTFDTHWRVIYNNPEQLWGIRPFLGWSYYYYRQAETSGGIGNLIRLQSYGPEFGASYSF
jgi:hypothetical protein